MLGSTFGVRSLGTWATRNDDNDVYEETQIAYSICIQIYHSFLHVYHEGKHLSAIQGLAGQTGSSAVNLELVAKTRASKSWIFAGLALSTDHSRRDALVLNFYKVLCFYARLWEVFKLHLAVLMWTGGILTRALAMHTDL